MKQEFIREKAFSNAQDPSGSKKILWSRHAVAALIDDDLDLHTVEDALRTCEVIEDYPSTHRPLPDCLVLATLRPGIPIHAVIAIDRVNDRIFIVTVYVPTDDRWENDWRTRKQ